MPRAGRQAGDGEEEGPEADHPGRAEQLAGEDVVRVRGVAPAAGLRADVEAAGGSPRRRLYVVCGGYLKFARRHPERYRTMFGGFWTPDLDDSSLTSQDLVALGADTMRILVEALGDCVEAGESTSTDVPADAVALWVGLHGFAHQRAVSPSFAWPEGIAARVITALAHLVDDPAAWFVGPHGLSVSRAVRRRVKRAPVAGCRK
ncbi:TetR-like C-terminal domain-containing protein [Streptomyces microflavus]|uniref:TetR-like C-terminal domain-containing protein n=1 Tax=Streptomyces microflavus TaxID=1919 RepID=UPI0037F9BD50